MRVLDVCCRWAGSTHDAIIFGNSRLYEKFEDGIFGNDSVLLCDSAYGPERYVCKPLRNPVSPAENRYQRAQIATRNVVERTIGVLKRRFHCLEKGMQFHINKIQDIIVACCVLHNMIISEMQQTPNIDQDEIDRQTNLSLELAAAQDAIRDELHIREFLINSHFA